MDSAFMKLVSRPSRPLAETHGKALPHSGNSSVSGLLVGLLQGDHFFEAGPHESIERNAPL